MSDIKLQFEGDIGNAARANAELLRQFDEFDESLKNVARSADKAKKSTTDAMQQTGKSAKYAKTQIKETEDGFTQFGDRAVKAMAGLALSFTAPAGLLAVMKLYNAELEKSLQLQKSFTGTAIGLDKMAQQTAALRGDASQAAIDKARADMEHIASRYKIPLEQASSVMYYSESAFPSGSQAAAGSAATIAMAAGAYQLAPQATEAVPGLFLALGADTPEKQARAMDMLIKGANMSQVDPSEYLQHIARPVATSGIRGISTERILGLYNAAIVARGGEAAAAGADVLRTIRGATGQNEQQMKFLTSESAAQRLNFAAMTDSERLEFTLGLVEQAVADGSTDRLKVQFGAEAFEPMLAQVSPASRRLARSVTEQTRSAADSGTVQRQFELYRGTRLARSVDIENAGKRAAAETGRQQAAVAFFDQMVEDVTNQAQAQATAAESAGMMFTPDKKIVADTLIREALRIEEQQVRGAYPGGWETMSAEDRARVYRLRTLNEQMPAVLSRNPAYLEQVFSETDNLQNLGDVRWSHADPYSRAFGTYFGSQSSLGDEAARDLTEALKEMTEQLKKQNAGFSQYADAWLNMRTGYPVPQGIFE